MATKKYLDEHGLETLVQEIKKTTVKVYKIKGSAIYADADYVTHATAGDTGYFADITSEGLWQLVDGAWTKVTEFEAGWVYNIQNTFTTNSDFIEGADSTVEAGSNIVVAEATDDTPPVYKWDQLGNVLDMTDYQTKKLVAPLTVFTAADTDNVVTYAAVSLLPASEAKATATIHDGMTAVIIPADTTDPDYGKVYRAVVTDDTVDATLNTITWTSELGDQITVEGALKLLGNVCPNTPISDDFIKSLFA